MNHQRGRRFGERVEIESAVRGWFGRKLRSSRVPRCATVRHLVMVQTVTRALFPQSASTIGSSEREQRAINGASWRIRSKVFGIRLRLGFQKNGIISMSWKGCWMMAKLGIAGPESSPGSLARTRDVNHCQFVTV